MCLILTAVFTAAAFFFYDDELMVQAAMSAFFASVALSYFSYMIFKKRRCLFGKERDCNSIPDGAA